MDTTCTVQQQYTLIRNKMCSLGRRTCELVCLGIQSVVTEQQTVAAATVAHQKERTVCVLALMTTLAISNCPCTVSESDM